VPVQDEELLDLRPSRLGVDIPGEWHDQHLTKELPRSHDRYLATVASQIREVAELTPVG